MIYTRDDVKKISMNDVVMFLLQMVKSIVFHIHL